MSRSHGLVWEQEVKQLLFDTIEFLPLEGKGREEGEIQIKPRSGDILKVFIA